MLTINVIKANDGCFINGDFIITNYLFNDSKEYESTYLSNWFFIKHVPKEIKAIKKKVVRKLVLDKEKSKLLSIKLSNIIDENEMDEYGYFDACDEFIWNEKHKALEYFYNTVIEKIEYTEKIQFKLIMLGTINGSFKDSKIQFPTYDSFKNNYFIINNANVEHQLIDKIIFPKPMLQDYPCKLSFKQIYDIVRHHIKTNINPKYAKIESDYDFCFSVKKILNIVNPYEETFCANRFEIALKKERKPKYKKRLITQTTKQIFEMTYSPEDYKGYTPIEPIIGKNHKDLKEKVDNLLKNIMEIINRPLNQCPRCEGSGVIEVEDEKIT